MTQIQQQLIDENKTEIENTDKAIELSESKIEKLEAELKVEKRLFNELKENNDSDMQKVMKQAEVNVDVLKSMILMEQNKLKELKNNLKILKLRRKILSDSSAGTSL